MSSDYFQAQEVSTFFYLEIYKTQIFCCKNFMAVHGSVLIGAGLNLGRVTIKITFLFKFLLYHLKFSSDFFTDKSSDLSPSCCVLPTSSLLIIFTVIFLFFPPRHHHQTFHNLLYLDNYFSLVFWKVLVVKLCGKV